MNFTVNVQSLVTLGIKNLLCLDNNFESDSNSARDEYAKVSLIKFGKKSCTNMPFHYRVPSPSTALILMKLAKNHSEMQNSIQ